MQKLKHRALTQVVVTDGSWSTIDEHLIHFATETGALLLDGMGDGICLGLSEEAYHKASQNFSNVSGRNYVQNKTVEQFLNATAFGILQATRTRISKTEYISCPSCGRTLFELQETTAKIRKVTHHTHTSKFRLYTRIKNLPPFPSLCNLSYLRVRTLMNKITHLPHLHFSL